MFEKDFFTYKERHLFKPAYIGIILFLVAVGTLYHFCSGPGFDYLWFKTRVFFDGQAERHTFFKYSDLENKVFTGLDLAGSTFPHVNLKNADLSKTDLKNSIFKDCDLTGANLKNSDLRNTYFINCNLEKAKLQFADLSNADIQGSNLKFSLLGSAKLKKCNIKNSDLRGAAGISTTELMTAKNWQLAIYDIETAQTIKMDFSAEGRDVPDFRNWNDWILQQKKHAFSVSKKIGTILHSIKKQL